MANQKNLKPGAHKLTVEEQSKGGKSSGVSRGLRSAIKKRLREEPETVQKICDMIIDKTLDGDLKALELLVELLGESPKQMEIALKKKELKAKQEASESGW